MRKRVSVLLVTAMLFLVIAWPVVADTIEVEITPLDPIAAFAIDASMPPPTRLGILKGQFAEFTIRVKNIASNPLNLYAKGYDGIPSGSDQAWALKEVYKPPLQEGEYSVLIDCGVNSEYGSYTLNKSGVKISNQTVQPNETRVVTVRIDIPTVVNTGPQQVRIDFYGSL